ncbi:MAG: hypothetical protein M1837_003219 [Sclerophora amabilis]|nr:MAG: hypothetical protein M1837_003219 [Sclerophora amabilis]
MPAGSKLVSASPHKASFWTSTARLVTALPDGSPKTYFLKVAQDDLGSGMLKGEYESAKLLHSILPDALPRPVGQGIFKSESNTHFYLCDFVDMNEELPDPAKFCAQLAKLHQGSIPLSPKGKFGFHVSTYQGNMPQNNAWCDTWEEYYVRGLKDFIKQEKAVRGPSEELDELLPVFFDKVVPRLLRPLETGGRKIEPCLLHGDIWYGNIAKHAATDEPIMFDPAAFWAHNEYELGSFRVPRYKLGWKWLHEYCKHFPKSSPKEDWEDRILIYSIHTHFCASTLYPLNTEIRQMAIDDITYLIKKYPEGLAGFKG